MKKTDKVDAKRMALMLKAGIIPRAHIPCNQTRLERDLVRQHISLTQQRTRVINQIKALMLRYHIKPVAKKELLKGSWAQNPAIPQFLRMILQQQFASVLFLTVQRREVDRQISQIAKQNPQTIRLKTIPGFGWFISHLITNSIDGIERFNSIDSLVSYSGLAPSIYQSGKTVYLGKISKQGRPELRWALVQAAWIAIRKSKRLRKKFLKLERKRGKKKAIVAIARKLLAIAYALLKNKTEFRECGA